MTASPSSVSGSSGTMRSHLDAYLERLRVLGGTERTVDGRRSCLLFFFAWSEARGALYPGDVTLPVLERYQRHLFHYRQPLRKSAMERGETEGRPLTFARQHQRLSAVRQWFRWLVRERILQSNPASELEMPKRERRLPKAILTHEEAEHILSLPDLTTPEGLRDRALLELLYATGLRRAEVAALTVQDVDASRAVINVRQGKGRRDRMTPIGERALYRLLRYLQEGRPALLTSARETEAVFVTGLGGGFHPKWLGDWVHRLVKRAGLGKNGACHLFRHTMATLMLEGGADLRHVQMMLGHLHLSTTELYTHVSVRHLQEVHARTHPASKLRPLAKASTASSLASGVFEEGSTELAQGAVLAQAE
jgi:integrase/recombinase XerD